MPIKQERNRVIIPTTINGSQPLNLIFDTGMRFDGVYLFHKEFADQIDTSGAIEVKVPGAGAGQASTNLMIESGTIGFGEMSIDSQRVIISQSPYTQSFPTDGAIGWNLLGHYAVEIDYDQNMIYLHDTLAFEPDSSWAKMPVTMKDGLPYVNVELEVVPGEIIRMDLYVDLASDKALELLTGEEQRFTLPKTSEKVYVGTGLSGDIHGYEGYAYRLNIFSIDLLHVNAVFAPAEVRSKQKGAEGILGNDAMRRFNIIFDYTHNLLYIKPNKNTYLPFD